MSSGSTNLERLELEVSQVTPRILFDPAGQLEIEGRSMPEDPTQFFGQLYNWIEAFVKTDAAKDSSLDLYVDYLNSSSNKMMLMLLKRFQPISGDLKITWKYDEGDEDMQETGELMRELSKLENFELIEV